MLEYRSRLKYFEGAKIFKNLLDFSYKRTVLEAIGFYIAYVVLCLLFCCALAGYIMGFLDEDNSKSLDDISYLYSSIFGIFISFVFALIIIIKKKIYKNVFALIFLVLTPLLNIGGLLFGLIPVSILTTFENENIDNMKDIE